jgi:hypothetical protein
MMSARTGIALVLLIAASLGEGQAVCAQTATLPPTETRADSVLRASVFLRPLASLLLPGTGQLLAHQDRGAVYLAAEVYLVSRFVQLDHDAVREANRYKDLAFEIARHPYTPSERDTIFEYFEQMERFSASGQYDASSGPAFVPESDPTTYNGAVWLLARRTYWEDPNVAPDPASKSYQSALKFYWDHAIGPGFQWSWRDHSLEHEVFKESIRRSDDAFRRAQNQVGLLLANHVVSAVDALISARLAAASGRAATIHTFVAPHFAQIRFTLPF